MVCLLSLLTIALSILFVGPARADAGEESGFVSAVNGARAAAGRPLRRVEAQALVDAMVPAGRGWSFGQAMLDLGASVCTSRRPDCARCPVREGCSFQGEGDDPATKILTSARPSFGVPST